MASLLLRAEAQNATDHDAAHLGRDDACVAGKLDLVDRGCATWRETTPRSHTPIWGALINITRDCNLDHTQSEPDASVNSFGLGSWLVGIQAAFQDFVSRFDADSGLSNAYRNRTVGEYISNWVEAWPTASNPGPIDWWMLGSEVFGEDLDHGAFLDLTEILMGDESYGFSDIPVQFRDAGSSAYAGRYTSLPLVLTPYNLLYRRDIFEQYNLSVPATWDDALDIADKYGRGALGPGQPDMGFCFESNPACGYAQAMIVYILASMVQLKGASDGAYFDPVTMDPLYTSPAMREALRIYGALRSHSVPDSTPCWAVYQMLASGRCLMLWTWSFNFKASVGARELLMRADVGRLP
ncbi:hypothetical protein HYH03_019112 [Edaphochlamys debaryana]|uniref:Extracellular solute-binding protein n=1 Tax=Edaphochlamys debaryana TaxID=47281 RepID=A0A835XEQ7_9CHLO|nr:hypothetical protein HYH03_019112 [Edaphochlamys debaryana]|eukprot:KAG2481935.1 hypothetical protein HYH03_019112 [Edaphochlamys debaryana]